MANDIVGWVAFIVLAAVAVLGLSMLALWLPSYRSSRALAGGGSPQSAQSSEAAPPERSFPIAVVAAHGVLAVTTVVLVLLAMLSVGVG